jgi:hypothetical protein
MSAFSSDHSRSKAPVVIVLVLIIAALGAGAWYLHPRFESDPPQISLTPNADVIGLAPLELQVTDKGTGLKSLTATLSQGGADQRLALEQFSQPVGEHKVTVALVKVPGVKEGPAVLRVTCPRRFAMALVQRQRDRFRKERHDRHHPADA